ncbi:MAG: T9SS type A sorting domain-containing protein [Cyclobacteriaceae bacterium]
MNKIYFYLTMLLVLCANLVGAQSWTVYEANVDPLAFDPAFEVTQQSNAINTILADPDDAANSLLQMTTVATSDNNQWRQPTAATAITVVIKAKSVDTSGKNLLFDLDIRNSTAGRYSLRVLNDGTYSVASGGSGETGTLGHTASEWTIFRFTKSGQDFAVYLDEDPTPVYTATSTSTSDGSDYFRFGDGWGSGNIDTQVDWVSWDFSGAYSPTDFALPTSLTGEPEGNWTVYNADVDPLSFDPAFEVTQQSNAINTILADPDNAANSLLQMTTAATSDNNQWRQPTAATDITIVIKAKSVDTSGKNLLFDMDIRNSTAGRYSLRVLNDGTYSVASGGSGETGTLGHNPAEWTIYRFTKSGQDIAVYLDEDPTPVYTATSTSTSDGSDYFRFGDGWGSGNIDTQIDWVTWDLTGAYSPSALALPDELVDPETPLGDWTVYNADVDPLSFDPAFEVTQQSDAINTILADPERAGNSLLQMTTVETSDNNQWRQPTAATDLTIVIKAKSVDTSGKNLLFDMDMRNSTAGRYSLRVLTDGTYSVASGGAGETGTLGHNAAEWTIYRFTKSGQDFAVYLDEDPTPVYTATSTSTSDGSDYFRFGDGWGSGNIDTQIDWVTWDLTGAYAPSETRLPDDLIKAPLGDWTVYEADVEPLSFDPAFEVTQQSNAINQIVADPDDASNSLLQMTTVATSDNNQWRQPTSETDVTIVLKAKSVDTAGKNLLFDMDIRNSTAGRYSLRVLTDGTYSVASGGSGETGTLGHNASEWTIFRFTKSGQDIAVYLDEDITPAFTATSTSTSDGSDYFRFGDGWGSGNIDTQIDWVVWDLTGAYSPYQTRLPDVLTGEVVAVEQPSISVTGSLDPLSQDLGLATDFSVESYTLSGSDLTAGVTITPPADFEVSINQTDWFTNASPLVMPQTSGEVPDTVIYVRLNATVVGEYSGDISHTSDGAEEETVSVSGTTVNLVPEITLIGALNAFVQNLSSPSASQNYRVSGVNLKDAITVTAPANFEVSSDGGTTWQTSVNLAPTDRIITNATVSVRMSASALGDYSGDIVHMATDAANVSLAVSGEVVPDPGINVTGELASFSQSLGTPSAAQSYMINGSNLSSGIVINLPEGYEISFTGDLWLPSLTLAPLDGSVASITLFIRLNASAEGSYIGNITHESEGIDQVNIPVSGATGLNALSIVEEKIPFRLWPNPSSALMTFERVDINADTEVSIYSLGGNLIQTYAFTSGRKTLNINVQSLPKGLYMVEYQSAGKTVNQKFIKE